MQRSEAYFFFLFAQFKSLWLFSVRESRSKLGLNSSPIAKAAKIFLRTKMNNVQYLLPDLCRPPGQ